MSAYCSLWFDFYVGLVIMEHDERPTIAERPA